MKWVIFVFLSMSTIADVATTNFLVSRGQGVELNPFYIDGNTFILVNIGLLAIFSLVLFAAWPNSECIAVIRSLSYKSILKRLFDVKASPKKFFTNEEYRASFIYFILTLLLANALVKTIASVSNTSVILFQRGAGYFIFQYFDFSANPENLNTLYAIVFLTSFLASMIGSFLLLKKYI